MANLRQDNPRRKQAREAWLATPPALIQKPLRFINDQTNTKGFDAKGQPVVIISANARAAYLAARRGNGRVVNMIARAVAA